MLYLRYKNSLSDPWTDVPSLTSIFPTQPVGSLPVEVLRCYTSTEFESPCGCPEVGTIEDRYALRAEITALPQSAMPALATFLLRYKEAAYHEAKHPLFGDGTFVGGAQLSLLNIKSYEGMSSISFRVAAMIADVI